MFLAATGGLFPFILTISRKKVGKYAARVPSLGIELGKTVTKAMASASPPPTTL